MGFLKDVVKTVSKVAETIGGINNDYTGTTSAQKQNYQHSLDLQKQNQVWQTEMSNTAHQREVADLEKAGLNPVLSAMGGNGATTGSPGGGTVGGTGGGGFDALTGVLSTIQTMNNSAKTQAEVDKIQTETSIAPEMAAADIALKGAQAGSAKAKQLYDTAMTTAESKLKEQETKLKKEQTWEQDWANKANYQQGTTKETGWIERTLNSMLNKATNAKAKRPGIF